MAELDEVLAALAAVVERDTAGLAVDADLRLELTTPAGVSTTARLTGGGQRVRVQAQRPDVWFAALPPAEVGRAADLLATTGITVDVHGPHGRVATLGADTSNRVGRAVTGSSRVAPTLGGATRLAWASRAVRVSVVALSAAPVVLVAIRRLRPGVRPDVMFARALTTTALGAGALLGAVALVAAPGTALSGAAFGTVVGVLVWRWVRDTTAGDAASRARAGRRAGAVAAAGVTGGALVLTGLVVLLGPASGPAVLLFLLALSFAVWWRRGRPASGTAPRPTPWHAARDRARRDARRPDPPGRATPRPASVAPVAPVVPIPATLSTPQLCLAWQRSYFALLDLPVGAPGGEIVGLRERLLDEIERRDPVGFTRWLDTGARAGSDPGRYLAGDR